MAITDRRHTAKLVSRREVAQATEEFTFKIIDGDFLFTPGQYAWIDLLELKVPDEKGERRGFSFVNAPGDSLVSIVARLSESGYKQTLFSLQVGAEINVTGPFGSVFALTDSLPDELVMIAGGVGVAPFLSVLRSVPEYKSKTRFNLIFLNDDTNKAPYLKELKAIGKKNKNITVTFLYEKFSVATLSNIQDKTTIQWWVAGSRGMIDFVYTELRKIGVAKPQMHFENFYPTPENSLKIHDIIGRVESGDSSSNVDVFRQALENSTNHVIITDINGEIIFANKAAQRITGFTFEEMRGNTPRLWGGLNTSEFYKEFWRNKLTGKGFDGEILNHRKNGELYAALGHISPIFDYDKKIIGFIGTEEDITEIKNVEKDLRESDYRYNIMAQNSGQMVYEYSVQTGKIFWSGAIEVVTGYSPEEFSTFGISDWSTAIHPEDSKAALDLLSKAQINKSNYQVEYRFRSKNGAYKYVADEGVFRDDQDGDLKMYGTMKDITERKEQEQKLEQRNLELERLNNLMIGRELKMAELKKKLKEIQAPPIHDMGSITHS